jgi:hypothetical protein
MHAPLVEGNLIDESGKAIKPRVVEDYDAYMGFVDTSEWRKAVELTGELGKWSKKLFFHVTDITILNAFLMHKSRGGHMIHKISVKFYFAK